ncbi:MAG: hypothetical protein JJE01_16475 [Gemmatimonadetes bacterium]|nr:hypothetical protein [Gemmatimonadota bacterium]
MSRASFESHLRTDINRALIEAGLDPSTIRDPAEPLRRLELLGNRRAGDLLRQLRRLGRA